MAFADFVKERVPRYQPPIKPKSKVWSVYDLKPGDLCLWVYGGGTYTVKFKSFVETADIIFGDYFIRDTWYYNGGFRVSEIVEYKK